MPEESNARETDRLEAFSDAVFAIGVSLLVLQLKVPEVPDGGASLGSALLNLWRDYSGHIFSFTAIAIYWTRHHFIFQLYKKTNHSFILLYLFFLLCVSFLPFPTAVLAKYITDENWRQTAIVFYACGLFLPAFAWLLTWLYGSRRGNGLLDEKVDEPYVGFVTRKYTLSNALYLASILLALWNGAAGLILCVGVTLVYLLPPKMPAHLEADS